MRCTRREVRGSLGERALPHCCAAVRRGSCQREALIPASSMITLSLRGRWKALEGASLLWFGGADTERWHLLLMFYVVKDVYSVGLLWKYPDVRSQSPWRACYPLEYNGNITNQKWRQKYILATALTALFPTWALGFSVCIFDKLWWTVCCYLCWLMSAPPLPVASVRRHFVQKHQSLFWKNHLVPDHQITPLNWTSSFISDDLWKRQTFTTFFFFFAPGGGQMFL